MNKVNIQFLAGTISESIECVLVNVFGAFDNALCQIETATFDACLFGRW